jgi:ketosteroid isomerase-like protein
VSEEDAVLAANAAYYDAFSARDFAAMSAVWADEDISCIHPGWPALVGRQAVLSSYREILRNPLQNRVVCRNAHALVGKDDARVLCAEIVGDATLAATNWFRRIDGAWRLIHHQASPIIMESGSGKQSLH